MSGFIFIGIKKINSFFFFLIYVNKKNQCQGLDKTEKCRAKNSNLVETGSESQSSHNIAGSGNSLKYEESY